MKCLEETLTGRQGSYILPFLWLRGEDGATVDRELDQIEACGIREICLESRPHPDFCGPGWWRDLDHILAEAKRRAMRVWVLDDDKFPTGHANGAFETRCPEKAKRYLAERHMDILGPCTGGAVLVEPFLQPDGRLLAIYACPKPDTETRDVCLDGAIELTANYKDGFVYFDLPAGAYRLFVLFTTRQGGGRPDYVNLIDADSVRVLIGEVYEKHYAHYKEYFGSTLAGFFSDEPELGNAKGYGFDTTLGTPDLRLPWSAALENALRAAWGADFAKNMPALWYGAGGGTVAIRTQYMETMSTLVGQCFSGQLGAWCGAHGVEYIGHIIEDDNAHARMGCSIGHYFREMAGQSMAGVDVVHHQIVPGFTGKIHQWIAGDADGEFFYYGLAKLASSAAHIDPAKQGRALCELFGNYGWAEGVSLMRWLTDHMLVRGINHFTPHAFSMRFPDPDCPPHFYAGGNNPQFGCFAALMRYMNRAAHLLSGGLHRADAAVLYHAESEWAGDCMLFQKPVRALMEHQIDCDVIPADALENAAVSGGRLQIGTAGYAALVLPACQYLPRRAAERAIALAAAGLPVLMLDALPEADTRGEALPAAFAGAVTLLPLAKLAEYWLQNLPTCLWVEPGTLNRAGLRSMLIRQTDGVAAMFFNESTTASFDGEARLLLPGCRTLLRADVWHNTAARVPCADGTFRLALAPGESAFYLFEDAGAATPDALLHAPLDPQAAGTQTLDAGWRVSRRRAGTDGFVPYTALAPGQYPNMNGPACDPAFSGTYRYEQDFTPAATDGARVFLRIPAAGDTAQIFVNGQSAGYLAAFPGQTEITGLVQPGRNTLALEIANTLVWQVRDGASTHLQLAATGLLAPPSLVVYHNAQGGKTQ